MSHRYANPVLLFAACLFVLMCSFSTVGCKKIDAEGNRLKPPDPNPPHETDYVLVIIYDLSGSYYQKMVLDGKAWKMSLAIFDKFRADLPTARARLVIAHISGNADNPIVWSGTLTQLKQEFSGPEDFRKHLGAKRGPDGSAVYESINETLRYVLALPDVQKGKPTLLCVFSDLEDTEEYHHPNAKNELLARLRSYGKANSAVGLYWVTQNVEEWKSSLEGVGMHGRYVVQPVFESTPRLPSFK